VFKVGLAAFGFDASEVRPMQTQCTHAVVTWRRSHSESHFEQTVCGIVRKTNS